jgi:hypothetical protein
MVVEAGRLRFRANQKLIPLGNLALERDAFSMG